MIRIPYHRNYTLGNQTIQRRHKRPEYTAQEKKRIAEYLENPTRAGIWSLHAKWHALEGPSKTISEYLTSEFKKDSIELQEGKRKTKLKPSQELLDDLKSRTRLMSFTFALFTALVKLERNNSILELEEFGENKLIFDLLDLAEIKRIYTDALTYFKEHLFFEEFTSHIEIDRPFRIKNGLVILTKGPREQIKHTLRGEIISYGHRIPEVRRIIINCLNDEPLERLKTFFEKIEKISDSTISPLFSPEEEVFRPYFSILEETFETLVENENSGELFRRSVTEYIDEDYRYCISSIGLIIEDYLIQIYETFFRDVIPKGLTLGEIFNQIQDRVTATFKQKPESYSDLKPIYDLITDLDNETNDIKKHTVSILREIVSQIKKDRSCTSTIVHTAQNKNQNKSIFPNPIIDNLKESIKNRNAISHKSTIPIGRYEALRTLYCCVTLILWWKQEKMEINWKEQPVEILRRSVDRNSVK